jgi:hypothetical protein
MSRLAPVSRKTRLSLEALGERINPSTGAWNLAVGNVWDNGSFEVITGSGVGMIPQVRLWDSLELTETASFLAYEPEFTGGVDVATGPLQGGRVEQIITGAGVGGGPVVAAFDGFGNEWFRFFAYEVDFLGGISVAVGDITGDGQAEIITGAGVGGGPVVAVFNNQGQELFRFFAYEADFRGGVNVAVSDVTGDGVANIITGAGVGGGPVVKVFNAQGRLQKSFLVFEEEFRGGVNVSTFGHTRVSTLAVSPAAEGGPHIKVYDLTKDREIASFFAYDSSFTGGIQMALGGTHPDGGISLYTSANADSAELSAIKLHPILGTHTWDNDFYLYIHDVNGQLVGSNVISVTVSTIIHTEYPSDQPADDPTWGYGNSISDGRLHFLWEVGHKGNTDVATNFSNQFQGGTGAAFGIRDDYDQKTATGMPQKMNFWAKYRVQFNIQGAGEHYVDVAWGMVGADKWKVFEHLAKDIAKDLFKDAIMEELKIPDEIAETVTVMDATSDTKETWQESENNYYFGVLGVENGPARKVSWGDTRGEDTSAILVPLISTSTGQVSDYFVLFKSGRSKAHGSSTGNGWNYVDVYLANFNLV